MQRMVQRLLEGEASVLALFASILGSTGSTDRGNQGAYGWFLARKVRTHYPGKRPQTVRGE